MIQGLSTHLRSFYKDFQVFYQLRLTRKILYHGRTDIILKLLVGRAQCILVGVEIEIRHITKIPGSRIFFKFIP